MKPTHLAILTLTGMVGCASPPVTPTTTEARAPAPHAAAEGAPLAGGEGLRASMKVPSQSTYTVDAFGVRGRSLAIRLVNGGRSVVEIGQLHARFTATREGVAFPCNERPEDIPRREPASLAPGQAFVFEREIDCTLALPGRYEVEVWISWKGATGGDRIGAFALDVVPGHPSPRSIPSRPGLYVAMTANRETRPIPHEAWSRGDYQVAVAVVNGGHAPVRAGNGRLSFATYKKGSALPCAGETVPVQFAESLAPGHVQVVHASVTCAPSEEGRYEIVGKLQLDGDDAVEIGRVAVKVSRDPIVFEPEPLPSSWGNVHDPK